MSIVTLFNTLSSSSKAADKEVLIKSNMSDTLCQIFVDTYDKSVTYGITSKNITVESYGNFTISDDYPRVHNLLKKLAERKITGNNAIENVESLLKNYTEEDVKYILRIIDRNLKIGVSDTQFNKWAGIKEQKFEVPLAKHHDQVKGVNWLDGTYYASHKLDGVRCLTEVDMDAKTVKFWSRSHKEYQTLRNLEKPILEVLKDRKGKWAIDGEICHLLPDGSEDFQSLMKEVTRKDHTILEPRYCVFDLVSWDVFLGNAISENFDKRYAEMKALPKNDAIIILEQELITSQDIFDKWRGYVDKYNWEGFMMRKNAPFKAGRSKDLLKVKPYYDAEYVVEDIVAGKQTFAEAGIGNVEYEGIKDLIIKHKGCAVNVGSGLSKEQRIEWLKKPEKIIGKTITVKYLEETQDQHGNWSLRHPTLKFVYDDERNT